MKVKQEHIKEDGNVIRDARISDRRNRYYWFISFHARKADRRIYEYDEREV